MSKRESFQCEWVKCGKQCGGCPHGPYWYAYWREGKKVKKRYCGKGDPRGRSGASDAPPGHDGAGAGDQAGHEQAARGGPAGRPHRLDAIFNDRMASPSLAWEILGCVPGGIGAATARYRELCKQLHPDRNPGADPVLFKRVQAAYAYLKRWLS